MLQICNEVGYEEFVCAHRVSVIHFAFTQKVAWFSPMLPHRKVSGSKRKEQFELMAFGKAHTSFIMCHLASEGDVPFIFKLAKERQK